MKELTDEVRQFLAMALGESVNRIHLETRLEEDLGVTGDDADELLQAFSVRFDIDMRGLQFHKHFGPEGCCPLWLLMLFIPDEVEEYGAYPVTVQHLVQVAGARHWFEPPERGRHA